MVDTALPRTDRRIVATGWLMALWCIGFAFANVWLEATGHFATGPYADYAQGLLIMNILVFVLKILGAIVELLAVADRPRLIRPAWTSTLAFGAFAMLGVYAAAGIAKGAALIATGSDQVDTMSIAYILFFILAATGFGTVAIAHWRRFRPGRAPIIIGALAAPLMLALILNIAPLILSALGVMPSV